MKRFTSKKFTTLFITGLALISFSFTQDQEEMQHPHIPTCWTKNEILDYRVHYGLLNAGEGRVIVDPDYYMVSNRPCFKAVCIGRSMGAFEMMLKIRDEWGTYIDTTTKISHRSYRNIEEGNYKLKEFVQFNYKRNMAEVQSTNRKGETKNKEFAIPSTNIHDIISGFYYMRIIDYSKYKIGDTIVLKAFFEDTNYSFVVKYRGKEKVKTRMGSINAVKLTPVMPKNGLFSGENSIRVWISDDRNRVPVKIQADMFVGAVEVDLKGYKNLKYPITFTK